jgi:hypothetical protein
MKKEWNKIKDYYNKHLKKYVKKYKYYIIAAVLILLALYIPQRHLFTSSSASSKIESICKLSTVTVTYHNVGSYKKDGKTFMNVGYKQYWVEYDAEVNLGIDCKKVEIKESLFSNTIIVKLPPVEIVGEVNPITSTFKEESDTGWFTSIDADKEMNYAKAIAKESIEEDLINNPDALIYARERVEEIYENYIKSFAKSKNRNVDVKFID